MDPTYRYVGNEHFVGLVRDAFATALEQAGYHLEVGVAGPGAPHVYEYRKEDTVVAVKLDDAAGEKWESELLVETEAPAEALEEVVISAVGTLLARVSRRLIESVLDDSSRAKVARQLGQIIATLE